MFTISPQDIPLSDQGVQVGTHPVRGADPEFVHHFPYGRRYPIGTPLTDILEDCRLSVGEPFYAYVISTGNYYPGVFG